jgi:DNA-binding MarR family transcriptional regulator
LASIWWLNKQGEKPNQLTLARHAGVDVKMTSQVIRSLEGKDLVERTADPADARARLLRVTSRGRRLAPRALETVEGVDREFFSAASDPDQVLSVLRELWSEDVDPVA